MTKTPPVRVNAVNTAITVVETLEELDGAGVTELADALDIPKSTALDHLQTLEANEFVVNDDGTYRVGLRFLDHGGRARSRNPLYEIGQPEIEKLASNTGELANLVVEEHGFGVYVAVERGSQAVHLDTYIGKREYLHSTAVGKAILAHLPRERVDEILDRHGLPAETDRTVTDREALYDRLDAIKGRGHAFDDEERLPGLRCVAAPIRTNEGRLLGAISISGPTSRLDGERFEEELPERVMRVSNIIEINVTYS